MTLYTSDHLFTSDWVEDNNATDHTTVIEHPLKEIPQFVQVFFSPDKEQIYPVSWSWNIESSGNPVTVSVDASRVTLTIWAGAVLHGVWTPEKHWTQYKQGYWKVNLLHKQAYAW